MTTGTREVRKIDGRECLIYSCGSSERLLIQPVDDHDIEVLDSQVSEIRRLADGIGFTLAAFRVNDWNDDLSPWEAPPVFGDQGFGGKAEATLDYVRDVLVPELTDGRETKLYIGGYSLAGFFALWASYQTDMFRGVAAASPSVWFPRFTQYMRENKIFAEAVYLSLGDREEKTRNPVMSRVGTAIREAQAILLDEGRDCMLEWNRGNHFKEPDVRTAKAFAWLMNRV